ncbi:MAG: 50S ribosomal protein L10 [Firmicutes bacterium]|nr:50S ribosomal protein L10 [Bacillota bacterium]
MDNRISKNKEAKVTQVAEIADKLKKAKSLVFVNYKGLNSKDDTAMRAKLRAAGCDYHVYKNKIMTIALNSIGINCLDGKLEDTLAVAFSYNSEIDAAKVLKTAADENKIAFRFGAIGNSFVNEAGIKALASLPSREVLIAQLLGLLNAPATNLAGVLNAPVRGLAVALSAIANK